MPVCMVGLADGTCATSLVVCPSWSVPAPQAAPPLLPLLHLVKWQQERVVELFSAASQGCQPSEQLAPGSLCAAGSETVCCALGQW